MDVKVFDEAGAEHGIRDLRDLLGDDEAGYEAARAEIAKCGRAWIGGGSAPLFLLMRAR